LIFVAKAKLRVGLMGPWLPHTELCVRPDERRNPQSNGNRYSSGDPFFEPRIVLEKVSVEFIDPLEGRLNIFLVYHLIETNERHNRVFPFYKTESTLLAGISEPA
jgi:hypothetical protein